MICRLRARAPLVLSILSLGIGLAMSAAAAAQGTVQITNIPQPVTQREFYTVLASGFVFIVLGTAGAVRFMFSASLHDLRGIVETLRESVARFEDRLYNHNESKTAHSAASEHNHRPIEEKIDATKKDLDEFIEWCRRHQCVGLPRDPAASPHPRRATDSDDDYTPLRGKP